MFAPVPLTVPLPFPLNVLQSAELKYPFAEAVATAIDISGVSPPEETIGADPVTAVTPSSPNVVHTRSIVEECLANTCPGEPADFGILQYVLAIVEVAAGPVNSKLPLPYSLNKVSVTLALLLLEFKYSFISEK